MGGFTLTDFSTALILKYPNSSLLNTVNHGRTTNEPYGYRGSYSLCVKALKCEMPFVVQI